MEEFDNIYLNMKRIILRIDKYILDRLSKTQYSNLSIAEIAIIDTIGKNNEKTITEIANFLEVSLSTPTRAMDRLVEKGYIIRETSKKDRRVVLSTLTDNGKEVASELLKYRRELFNIYLDKVDKDDFVSFQKTLEDIIEIGD